MTSLPARDLEVNFNVSTISNLEESFSVKHSSSGSLREQSIPLTPPTLSPFNKSTTLKTLGLPSDHKPKSKRERRRHNSLSCRGAIRPLLEENQKLRAELEDMQNQVARFQSEMPSIYDEMEAKVNEISYLKSSLESWQKKYQILSEQQKTMKLKMTWDDEDMQQQLDTISSKSSKEIESIKDRLFQQVNRLSQELTMETHQRNVLVNDLVLAKQQLAKLKKVKDNERHAYLLNISDLQQTCRTANREKQRYRLDIEKMREQIFSLQSELEKQKELVGDKDRLLQTLKEDKSQIEDNGEGRKRRSSVETTILPESLAAELSHNENLIVDLRRQRIDAEEDFEFCREHLVNVLELMEYAVSHIVPESVTGDGFDMLEKAITDTRNFLGLEPLNHEESDRVEKYQSKVRKSTEAPQNLDESTLYNENLVLQPKVLGTGLDEVDFGLSDSKENIKANEAPEQESAVQNFVHMEEFKQQVVKEVSKMKKDILEEFKILAQDHLRTSVVEEQHLKDTIQNSSQDSAQTVIKWIEKERRSTQEVEEKAAEEERVLRRSIEEEEKQKNKQIVEKMTKKIDNLETKLKTANSEIESLKEQQQKDAIERLRLKSEAKKLNEEAGTATSQTTPDESEEKKMSILRLDERAGGLMIAEQRECVTTFLVTYSNSSSWITYRDTKLQTTVYMFEFDGSMWKTRISFLYPFVNYLTQVIGVNKKALGSVLIILPTSTVGIKVRNLAHTFKQMQKTLEQHDSDSLWKYIFIFLKNVATHYREIKRFVGSRTRTDTSGGTLRTNTVHSSGRKRKASNRRRRSKEASQPIELENSLEMRKTQSKESQF